MKALRAVMVLALVLLFAPGVSTAHVWFNMTEPVTLPTGDATWRFATAVTLVCHDRAPAMVDLVVSYDPTWLHPVDVSIPTASPFAANYEVGSAESVIGETRIVAFQTTRAAPAEEQEIFALLTWEFDGPPGGLVSLELIPQAVIDITWRPVEVMAYGTLVTVPVVRTLSLTGVGGAVAVDEVPHELPWAGVFASGEDVSLRALPDPGYQFATWSGDLASTDNPVSIAMDTDKTVHAEFIVEQFTLALSGDHGQVKVNGAAHSLPWSDVFPGGTQVWLEAVPATGYRFDAWSGDLATSENPVAVTLDTDKTIVAEFVGETYAVSLSGAHGQVKVDGVVHELPWSGDFEYGAEVLLEAVADVGYEFDQWSGDLTGSENPTTITVDGSKSVAAAFSLSSWTLNLTGAHGHVKVNGIDRSLPWSSGFEYGTEVWLEAVGDVGYEFGGWGGDLTGQENPASIVIDGNKSVEASFSPIGCSLSLTGAHGQVKVDGVAHGLPWSGDFEYGAVVMLEALSEECWRFEGWYGDLGGRENPTQLTMDGDKDVFVSFPSELVFIDVSCDSWASSEIAACSSFGIITGYPDGTYHPEDPVTRDQMAAYISRALAGGDEYVPEFTGTPSFSDVGQDHWALDYVEYAVEQSVVAGYGDGTYQPDEEVTRDQMAVYVARAMVAPAGEAGLADYVPADPRNFPDVPSDHWAYTHIEYCVENGVVSGYDDGNYHPEAVVTRDQMAVYVARAFGLL